MIYTSHGTGKEYLAEVGYGLRKLGKDVIIEPEVLIYKPQCISIGQGTYIGNRTILKGYTIKGYCIEIGEKCWIGENAWIHGAGGIVLGNRVGIGPNVTIGTSFHLYGRESQDNIIDNPIEFRSVVIEEGADIGAGSVIAPGTHIGRGAQVYCGSVVKGKVPAFAIWDGREIIGFRPQKKAAA